MSEHNYKSMDEYDPLLAAYNNGNGDQTGKSDRQAQRMAFTDHVYGASEPIEPDYEPEQEYGTAEDLRRHERYGGTRNDY